MRVGRKVLAISILIALSAPPATMSRANAGGIPVIDASNLTQNIMTAIESVVQTLKQIEQYKTQLQQYENMLQNTLAPAAYIWDQAVTTMNELRAAIDTLNFYKRAGQYRCVPGQVSGPELLPQLALLSGRRLHRGAVGRA